MGTSTTFVSTRFFCFWSWGWWGPEKFRSSKKFCCSLGCNWDTWWWCSFRANSCRSGLAMGCLNNDFWLWIRVWIQGRWAVGAVSWWSCIGSDCELRIERSCSIDGLWGASWRVDSPGIKKCDWWWKTKWRTICRQILLEKLFMSPWKRSRTTSPWSTLHQNENTGDAQTWKSKGLPNTKLANVKWLPEFKNHKSSQRVGKNPWDQSQRILTQNGPNHYWGQDP